MKDKVKKVKKFVEPSLNESERRYRRLFETARDGILILDAQTGAITDVNPFLIDMLGYSRDDFMDKKLWEVGAFKDIKASKDAFETLEHDKYIRYDDLPLKAKDGHLVQVEFVSNVYPVNSHKVIQCNVRDITERKWAEKRAHEHEARYRLLFESAPTGVLLANPQGEILEVNPAALRIFGSPWAEATQNNNLLTFPPLIEAGISADFQKAVDNAQSGIAEYQYTTQWGKTIFVTLRFTPLFSANGNLEQMQVVIEDDTERKQAEARIADSEAKLRALLASMQDVVLVIDREGTYREIAPTNPDVWYITPQELLGKRLQDVFPAKEAESFHKAIQQVLGTKQTMQIEYELVFGDQSIWYEASISPMDADSTLWVAHDMTKRKQAEEKLAASEAELRALFTSMTDAVIVLDADGRYVKIAPTNTINLYRSPDEMLGKTVHEILPKEQADYIIAKTREAIRTGQIVPAEYALQIGGKEIWLSCNVTRLSENTALWVAHDITQRKQAEMATQEHLAELGMLYESGLALGQLLSPKMIAQKVVDVMSAQLDWHHIAIRLYHPEDETLKLLAFYLPATMSTGERRLSEERFKSLNVKTEDGLSGWAIEHRQVVRVDDLSHDRRYLETFSGMGSGLYIPLKVGERVVGVISIESEKQEAFSEADERLTVTLANQAAIALENAHLYEETLHQLRQLQALHTIDRTIAGSFDQRMMLDVLLTQTLSQLEAEAAAIFLIQPHQRGALQYAAGQGFNTGLIQIASLKLGNSLAGEAVTRRELIHVREPEQREPDPLLSKLWLEEGFKSMHVIPLISKGEVKGVITVFHRKNFTPNPTWSSFLETLAGQAAIAIDVTQMFDNLQRANMELTVAYEATIEGWSQAMDLRDKETEGHTQRVTQMSQRLGKAMQLGEESLIHMRRGALLHDIGKLGVPDHILLKPDKLTDEEWLIMRKHPEFAHDMLHSISYLRDSLDIPYCHHEKWDGTGYPQGLKGEQIPLAARIFAIVDVWDALTSDRPYRQAWSKPDALKYIREQSGKHFDPQVVDIFLKEFGNE